MHAKYSNRLDANYPKLRYLLLNSRNIGADIDDTMITESIIIDQFNKKFQGRLGQYNLLPEKCSWLKLEQLKEIQHAGIRKEDIVDLLKDIEEKKLLEKARPEIYCMSSLKLLSNRGHKVYLITARDLSYYVDPKGMTKRWLSYLSSEHGFNPSGCMHEKYKESIVDEYGINLFFEDNLYVAKALLDKGINVVLFNRPWNVMNSFDSQSLSDEIYQKKNDLIGYIEQYNTESIKDKSNLIRVNNWLDVFKNIA